MIFEDSVFLKYPEIAAIKDELYDLGRGVCQHERIRLIGLRHLPPAGRTRGREISADASAVRENWTDWSPVLLN